MKYILKKQTGVFFIVLLSISSKATAAWWDTWIAKPTEHLYQKTALWAKKHPTAAKVAAISAGVTTVSFLAYAGYRWYSQPSAPQQPQSSSIDHWHNNDDIQVAEITPQQNTTNSAQLYDNNTIQIQTPDDYNNDENANDENPLHLNDHTPDTAHNEPLTSGVELIDLSATTNNDSDHAEAQKAIDDHAPQPHNTVQQAVLEDDATKKFTSYIPKKLRNDSKLANFINASFDNTKKIGSVTLQADWITSDEKAKIVAVLYIIDQFSIFKNIQPAQNPQDKSLAGIIIHNDTHHSNLEEHANYYIEFTSTKKLITALYSLFTHYSSYISTFVVRCDKKRKLQISCTPQQALTIEQALNLSFTKQQSKQVSPTFSYQDALPCYKDTIETHFNKNNTIYQAHNTHYACSVVTAPLLVFKGQNIFYRLSTGKATAENFKQQVEKRFQQNNSKPLWKIYLDEICIPLCWAAYYQDLAIGTTKSGFTEGTFTLIDTTGEITKILYQYLQIVEQAGYDIGSCHNLTGSNPIAYYRTSTHPGKQQFGMDIVDENLQKILVLPQEKCHLLIGVTQCPDGTQRILFKPENHGIYNTQDLAMHSWQALVAQARKYDWIGNILQLTRDDAEDNRKERVPQKISQLITELLQETTVITCMPKTIQKIISNASKKDISLTLELLKSEIEDSENSDYIYMLSARITKIMRQLPQASRRLGNEVLITDEDMMIFGYQGMLAVQKSELSASYKNILAAWITMRKLIFIDKKNTAKEASAGTQQAALNFVTTFTTTIQQNPSLFHDHTKLHTYFTQFIDIIAKRTNTDEFVTLLLEDDIFDQQQQKCYTYKDTCTQIIQNYVGTCCSLLQSDKTSDQKYEFTPEEKDTIGEKTTPLVLDHFRAYLPGYAYNDLLAQAKTVYKKLQTLPYATRKNSITTIATQYSECKQKLITNNQAYNYYSGHGHLQAENEYMLKQIAKIDAFSQKILKNCSNNTLHMQVTLLQKSFTHNLILAKTFSEYKRLIKKIRRQILLNMESLQSAAMDLNNSMVIVNA